MIGSFFIIHIIHKWNRFRVCTRLWSLNDQILTFRSFSHPWIIIHLIMWRPGLEQTKGVALIQIRPELGTPSGIVPIRPSILQSSTWDTSTKRRFIFWK